MMFRHAPRLGAIVLAVAASTIVAPAVSAQSYWFESYEKAIRMIDAGRPSEARAILDDVMKQQPVPIPEFRAPGNRFIDYAPYHYRARIQLAAGDVRGASHSLDVSEAFGESRFSEFYTKETSRLRQEIAARGGNVVAGAGSPVATPGALASRPPR